MSTNFTRYLFESKAQLDEYIKAYWDLFRHVGYAYAQQDDGRWLLIF